ncbi:Phosphoenolpyruvate synthase [uncultured archaeon]|nr:Phosphoenolpyruvate synthase [uncultured archaeon]
MFHFSTMFINKIFSLVVMTQEKFVYSFKEGNKDMKEILGGKGANLAEMTSIGLPVPPGFTITTTACDFYYKNGKKLNEDIKIQISEKLDELESDMGKRLGDKNDPLLVSVRSGAASSMPGMMDTILNLGLNDDTVEGIAKKQEIQDLPLILTEDLCRCLEML